MNKVKVFIILILTLGISLFVTANSSSNQIESFNYSSVSISNSAYNLSDYYSTLEKISSDNNITMLNARIEDDHNDWYCIGNCGLEGNQYYATINDKEAKAVLPVRVNQNPRVYSFASLSNIDTNHLNFILVGKKVDIKNFKSEINKTELSLEDNKTEENTPSKGLRNLSYTLLLIFIYIIILSFNSKQYIIDKYNGLYLRESITQILLTTGTYLLVSSSISVIIIFLSLNNNALFYIVTSKLIVYYLLIFLLASCIELIICIYYRMKSNLVSQVSTRQLFGLWVLVVIVCFISLHSAVIAIDSIGYQIDKLSQLPPSKYDNYYTYGLGIPGTNNFDTFEQVIDPGNIEFYNQTEDKYDGIVMSFTGALDDYNVVNENYLKAIGRDIDLDENYINILTANNEYDNQAFPSDVKVVHVENDTYPYINQDTGLIDYYNGPVVVINCGLIPNFEKYYGTGLSMFLQRNNYYLKGNVNELENVRNSLGMDQYMIGFYNVPSISNDYTVLEMQRLVTNGLVLLITTVVLISMLWIYLLAVFELNKKEYSLLYFNGDNLFLVFSKLAMTLIIPLLLELVLVPLSGAIIYVIVISIIIILLTCKHYTRLIKNKSEYVRE